MSAKYLLPCRCGQQIVVEPRQAGQTATCPCGLSLPVPTLLEMSALETAPDVQPVLPSAGTWGWPQRMVMLGAVLLLAAMVLGVWLYRTRPIAPIDTIDTDTIRQGAGNLPPTHTWHYWRIMKQGLDRRTDQAYEAAMLRFHVWQTASIVLALGGVALLATGIAKGRGMPGKQTGSPGDRPNGIAAG